MLPDNLLTTLRALSLTDKFLPSAIPDKESAAGKSAFEVGQKIQGTIIASSNPGVYKVRVLDQMLNMPLPTSFKSGDVVELQVMSLQPRLTFSMAASSNPLSTPEKLSSTARLLSALTQKPPEQSFVRPTQSAPLLSLPAELAKPSELAGKLRDSLSQSGLFYESHQAQWVAGGRSVAQLLAEPQNQPGAHGLSNLPFASLAGESVLPEADVPVPLVSNSAPPPDKPVAYSQSSAMPEHVVSLVQQQLNTLETRQLVWQGEVWPRQEMSWEIHDEGAGRGMAGEVDPQWATQIRLDLPQLGEVAAMFRFNKSGISLTLDASDSQTRELLGGASSQLVAALTNQGIPVVSTMVTRHDDPQ